MSKPASLPSTPNPNTADPNPLLTLSRYQLITGDTDSGQSSFDAVLADVVTQTAQECKRTWLYGQYTEKLFLYKTGIVYPSATPIDDSMPIQSGSETFTPTGQEQSIVQGAGIWVGWFTPLPWMPVWTGVIPPQTVVTYYGGYTQSTIPPKLARLFAKIAYYMLHPVALQGMPGGTKSMSVGGVSISGDLSSIMDRDPQIARDIARFTRPQVRAWEV